MSYFFADTLLRWAKTLHRPMPWRGIRDPYRIWLSEIILQQTRVEQGRSYYEAFVRAFPEVEQLAQASEQQVLALWQGLGYYSRARNLHKAAKQVVAAGGQFPTSYAELIKLPGVGPYTAAAVASFAYDEPVAVVDGNVYRVLSRYFGLDEAIDKPAGQRKFRQLAQELLPPDRAAAYNQAIMDFGATVCTPKRPRCHTECPLSDSCVALATNRIGDLPRKEGKPKKRTRYFDYLHITNAHGHHLLRRRDEGDIWAGLYDFPLLESAAANLEAGAVRNFVTRELMPGSSLVESGQTAPVKHILSHQELVVRFWRFECGEAAAPKGYRWIAPAEIKAYGLPRVIERYLEQPVLSLAL